MVRRLYCSMSENVESTEPLIKSFESLDRGSHSSQL
jgi:hypothetical protein